MLTPATRHARQDFLPGGASEPAGPGANAAGMGPFPYTARCGAVLGHTGNTLATHSSPPPPATAGAR